MANIDEAFAALSDVQSVSVNENVDFVVDSYLRVISIPVRGVVLGVEGDKDVNRVTFRMSRTYKGVDMSQFQIRINYANANNELNYFKVTEITVSDDEIVFVWVVGADAVAYVGNVEFVVRFIKLSGSNIIQELNTTLATAKSLIGLSVDGEISPVQREDLLAHFYNEIDAYSETKKNEILDSIPEDYTALANEVDELKGDLDKLNEGGLVLKDKVIEEDINKWLNEHPEATTTVQDGAITKEKLAEDLFNMIRNKSFDFCKAINIIKSDTYEQIYSLEDVEKNIIDSYLPALITKGCLSVNIRPSKNDITAYETGTKTLEDLDMIMFPDYKTLEGYIDLCDRYGIKIYHIKFHSVWLRDNTTEDIGLKITKHFEGVLSNLESFKQDGYTFEYIGVENEAPSWSNHTNTITGVNSCKAYGKVAIEGVTPNVLSDEVMSVVDFLSPHFYVSTSRLGSDSTIDFVYQCMKHSGYDAYLKDALVRGSNKPVILGEAGCKSQWGALFFPESWSLTEETVESGEPQILYISAMIKFLRDFPNVVSVNWWWELTGSTPQRVKQFQIKGE